MSDKVNRGKTIGVVHVVYLSIIFIAVVVWLVSYIFGSSSYAGSLLTFGATLSSILLAVIAIIITLIDVAGQRSNILDVKNSVEDLKTVSSDITLIVEEFEKRNKLRDEDMLETIVKFNNDNEANSEKFDEITDKLGQISLTGESKDEIENIKIELTGMKDKMKEQYLPSYNKNKSEILLELLSNPKKIDNVLSYHVYNAGKTDNPDNKFKN